MNAVLGILFLYVEMVCNWTLTTRKVSSVRPNKFLWMLLAEDDAFLSFASTNRGIATSSNSCGLHAGVLRTRRSQSCLHCFCDFL